MDGHHTAYGEYRYKASIDHYALKIISNWHCRSPIVVEFQERIVGYVAVRINSVSFFVFQ